MLTLLHIMQTITEHIFDLQPPGGLFDQTVMSHVMPHTTKETRKVLLSRAVKKQEIIRIRPGLYCLAPKYRKTTVHPFVIAAMIHAPSHISFHSALHYHGLIPEMVYTITSVTQLRSRTFTTPLGVFSYQRVPMQQPLVGMKMQHYEHDLWAYVATPLRALADIIYEAKHVDWKTHGSRFCTESLRIDDSSLREFMTDGSTELIRHLPTKRVREYIHNLREEILHGR